jgi:hypothetical protein
MSSSARFKVFLTWSRSVLRTTNCSTTPSLVTAARGCQVECRVPDVEHVLFTIERDGEPDQGRRDAYLAPVVVDLLVGLLGLVQQGAVPVEDRHLDAVLLGEVFDQVVDRGVQ